MEQYKNTDEGHNEPDFEAFSTQREAMINTTIMLMETKIPLLSQTQLQELHRILTRVWNNGFEYGHISKKDS